MKLSRSRQGPPQVGSPEPRSPQALGELGKGGQAGPEELAEVGAELKAPWTSYPDTEALTDSSCQPEPNGSCFLPPWPQQVLPPQEAPPPLS